MLSHFVSFAVRSLTAGVVALLAAAPAGAADPGLEARLARVERILDQQPLSDLVLQLQQLQQEVQTLRGQVETLHYRLERSGGSGPRAGFDLGGDAAVEEPVRGFSNGSAADGDAPGRGSAPSAGWSDWRRGGGSDASGRGAAEAPVSPAARGSGLLGLPAPETSAGGERALYRKAFELLKARDYAAAREAFGDLIGRYPQGQYADNTRYWLGEIGYATQDYPAALAQFDRLVDDYPLSPKVPGAMLKMGYVHYEQDDRRQARALLEEVVKRFPDSTEARLAQARLERMEGERD